jgi:hypothetical protein
VGITDKKIFFALFLLATSIGSAPAANASVYSPGEVSRFDITCSLDISKSYSACMSMEVLGVTEKISIETTRPPVFNLTTKRLERGAGNHPILFIPDDLRFYDFAKSAGKSIRIDSALVKRPMNLPGGVEVSHAQNFSSYILITRKIIPKRGLISAQHIRPPPSVS